MEQINRQSIQESSSTAVHAAGGRGYGRYVMPAILLAVLFVAGCAGSLSKEECAVADWYSVGVEDGSKGYDLSRLGAHRKACAKVGVTPDADRYAEGRLVGLQSYCTYQRGYAQGQRGAASQTVCPAGQLEAEFMSGYHAGLPLFCTYERGYAEGKRGASNRGVCPPGQLEAQFAEGYAAGRYAYQAKQQIRGLQVELSNVRNEIALLRQQLEAGVVVDESGQPHQIGVYEKRAMLDRLLILDREEGRLMNEIATIQQL